MLSPFLISRGEKSGMGRLKLRGKRKDKMSPPVLKKSSDKEEWK